MTVKIVRPLSSKVTQELELLNINYEIYLAYRLTLLK